MNNSTNGHYEYNVIYTIVGPTTERTVSLCARVQREKIDVEQQDRIQEKCLLLLELLTAEQGTGAVRRPQHTH